MHRTEQLVKYQNASKELLKIVVLEDKRLAIRVTLRSQFLPPALFRFDDQMPPTIPLSFRPQTGQLKSRSLLLLRHFRVEKMPEIA